MGCQLQIILLKRKLYLWATKLFERSKFDRGVIQAGTSKDSLISAYPFVDCYLYLTKILHLVDIPCNVIQMEIVSYPRGKVRRCFQGLLITALFYNKGTSFFYLFIHFYVTLKKTPAYYQIIIPYLSSLRRVQCLLASPSITQNYGKFGPSSCVSSPIIQR